MLEVGPMFSTAVRALLMIAVLAVAANAQHKGNIPPALVWSKLKGNCTAGLDWASLRGKVVVVSLTSCFIFPEEILAWNEVVQKFQGDQVLFIRVFSSSE